MEHIDASVAKAIVKHDLREWRGTHSELTRGLTKIFNGSKRVASIDKREALIEKKLKKNLSNIYCRKIQNQLTQEIAFMTLSPTMDDSVATIQQAKAEHKYEQYNKKIAKKHFHAFVVKDDVFGSNGALHIVMYPLRAKDTYEMFNFYTVAVITKHCLERMVERLNLTNIRPAIEEILDETIWLEGSGHELARRPKKNDDVIKRHVPTKNGALLLSTSSIDCADDMPMQNCALVTWISKRQFFKGQEVERKDFKFTQMINFILSAPDLEKRIEKYSDIYDQSAESASADSKIDVFFHGEHYSASKFVSTLKEHKYLDTVIDFEK